MPGRSISRRTFVAFAPAGAAALGAQSRNEPVEDRVDALLKQMTAEEKVGQMTQVTIDVVSRNGEPHRLDPSKVQTAVDHYKVGSILNVMGHAYTVDHWHEIINQIQDAAA
jgi:beta-glucosidase